MNVLVACSMGLKRVLQVTSNKCQFCHSLYKYLYGRCSSSFEPLNETRKYMYNICHHTVDQLMKRNYAPASIVKKLTSVDKSINIFYLPDGRMVAVRHQGLDGVQQAVNIDNGPVILYGRLQLDQPVAPVLVLHFCRRLRHLSCLVSFLFKTKKQTYIYFKEKFTR